MASRIAVGFGWNETGRSIGDVRRVRGCLLRHIVGRGVLRPRIWFERLILVPADVRSEIRCGPCRYLADLEPRIDRQALLASDITRRQTGLVGVGGRAWRGESFRKSIMRSSVAS